MRPFQPIVRDTSLGAVGLGLRPEIHASKRPVLVLIHGLGRNVGVFVPLIPAFEALGDVVFVELPAHGRAPAAPTPSLEVLANRTKEALAALLAGREMVIAGESLGGLLALALSSLARRVVAIDPPLTTAKLWPVQRWRRHDECFAPYYESIFGIAGGAATDIDYRGLITGLACPAEILAGSEPLQPPRETTRVPSLVDEEDRAFIRQSRMASLTVVDGGHALLDTAPEECLAAITRALQAPAAA